MLTVELLGVLGRLLFVGGEEKERKVGCSASQSCRETDFLCDASCLDRQKFARNAKQQREETPWNKTKGF